MADELKTLMARDNESLAKELLDLRVRSRSEATVHTCEVCGSKYRKIAEDGSEIPGCAVCLGADLAPEQLKYIEIVARHWATKATSELQAKLSAEVNKALGGLQGQINALASRR